MWIHEHAAESPLAPAAIWKVLSDLDRWTDWDTSMEWVKLDGGFVEGGTVTMKPLEQDLITSTITNIIENSVYADECEFNGLMLRFSHRLSPLPSGGTEVVHRLEIDGPDEVCAHVGPMIVEDFPEAMDALLAHAAK